MAKYWLRFYSAHNQMAARALGLLYPILKKCKIFMFADDIAILYAHSDFKTCNEVLQSEFNVLNEWSHDNKLCINMKKTQCIHFCPKSMRGALKLNIVCHLHECLHTFEINCKCSGITQVEKCVYLGLHLDQDFSWKGHIKHLVSKISSVVREMNFSKSKLNYKARKIIYHALAHSHLNYGITAWGSATLTPLFNVQNKLLYKMCSKKHKTTEEKMFKFWNVLPVTKLFELNVICIKYFEPHGTERQHSYHTRMSQNNPLVMPKSENKFFERTYNYIVPRLWNSLSPELKNFVNIKQVKRHVKKWLKSKL
jgi:Reverse transcriptase (RNA-dependent DNA polymerase)